MNTMIVLTDPGYGAIDATVEDVCVKEKQFVCKDEILLELQSDTHTFEVPARSAGLVKAIMVQKGQRIKVGGALMVIDTHQDMILPDLGEGIAEAEVLRILVKHGQWIEIDQYVMEVETDKAAVEIPSAFGGKVRHIHVVEGEDVEVGRILISFISELSDDEVARHLAVHNIRIGLHHLANLKIKDLTAPSKLKQYTFPQMHEFLETLTHLAKKSLQPTVHLESLASLRA